MSKKPSYIFMGGTPRGNRLLNELIRQGHLPEKCFILKEDEHEEIKVSAAMEKICKKNDIDFVVRKKLTEDDEEFISSRTFDFAIVCGWRTIINTQLNRNFKIGIIAAHDSLLPKYRGFAPLNWCIINGEKETGVTLFLISDGNTDSGPIIAQKIIPIKPDEYAAELYEKIIDATISLYSAFLSNFINGKKIPIKRQNEAKASYTCKRTPGDGKIDWKEPSGVIYNLIRGLACPYPGAFCTFNNTVYHIRKAKPGKQNKLNYAGRIPGRVISVSGQGIEVLCGKGSIFIEEWEDKKASTVSIPSEQIKSITTTLY